MSASRNKLLRLVPAGAFAALFLAWWMFVHRGPAPLVVYCAHDSIYSEKILRDFESRTGIPVAIRFDTEATKSLGLVELLVQEKDAPRCDVFWNNELLGTMDLAERGILDAYKGPGWQRIPGKFRDTDGRWTGFAARMRVIIANRKTLGPALPEDFGQWAIAKPLYGTTLTHYTVLWHTLGPDGLKALHRRMRDEGILELNGNAAVKNAVANGVRAAGYTDTDDAFEAKDDGQPTVFSTFEIPAGESIVIPNTVAVIHRTKREKDARTLVDFLLSEETELALAGSKSRQIPLGPVSADHVSAEVRELMESAKNGMNLTALGPARKACLEWLKSEYLK